MRVLGRVERFRDRLQLDVRTLEASEVDPTSLTPAIRRDVDELAGFPRLPRRRDHASRPRGDRARRARRARAARRIRRRPTTTTPTRAACSSTRSASRRSAGRRRSSIRVCAPTCCSRRRSSTTSGARSSSARAGVRAHRGRPPARARPPRPARDRAARERARRGAARGAPALRRRATTTRGRRAPPRRPCSTTQTSSTRSPRPDASIDAASARARREPRLGVRGLLRPARQPHVRRASHPLLGAGRRSRRDRGSWLRFAVTGRAAPGVLFAIAAAIGGTLGLYAYYRGMQIGAMSVVAPIAGVSAVVPVVFGIATGDSPSVWQLAGMACALVGVALASVEHSEGSPQARGGRRSRAPRGDRLRLLLPVDARRRQGRLLVGLARLPRRRRCCRRRGVRGCAAPVASAAAARPCDRRRSSGSATRSATFSSRPRRGTVSSA